MRGNIAYARRKGEHGSAILESFLSMILLALVLFGVLQFFQLTLANMVTDYTAFRGARSAAVGFKNVYANCEALVKSVPAAGNMIVPDKRNFPGWGSVTTEQSYLRSFMEGERYMEYAYWFADEIYHMNYYCPHYGERLEGYCNICLPIRTIYPPHVRASVNESDQTMRYKFEFINYPLNIPLYDVITGMAAIDISSEVELTNHSSAFLE